MTAARCQYTVTVEQRGRILHDGWACDQSNAVLLENKYIAAYSKLGYTHDRRTIANFEDAMICSTVSLVRWIRTLNPVSWLFPRRERVRIRITKQAEN